MNDYRTNWSGETIGTQPSGWAERWATAGSDWLITAVNSVENYLYMDATAIGNTKKGLGIHGQQDLDFYTQTTASVGTAAATSTFYGIVVRGSGAEGSENGYTVTFAKVSGVKKAQIRKYINGVGTSLGEIDYPWSSNSEFYTNIRFQIIGSSLKAKIWYGLSGYEPDAWSIEVTDTEITESGWMGFVSHYIESSSDLLKFSYVSITDPIIETDDQQTIGTADGGAVREIIRVPFKSEFNGITDAGFRYLQQISAEINRIRSGTQFGTPTSYTEIEKDGTIRLYGDATAWIDLDLDLKALATGAATPDIGTVGAGTIQYLLFDGLGTTEAVNGCVEIQHDVVMNIIKPHIHWFPTTAAAGNVKWNLTYTITNMMDIEQAETTISVVDAAPGAIQAMISGFPDIDISGFTVGAQMSFRIWRNPSDVADTYGADVATKTFGLHVEIQSLGTRDVITD